MREDWVEVELGESCEIHDNLRKPINVKERERRIKGKKESDLYPYFGATGQVGFIDDYLTDGEYVLIGEDGAPFYDQTKNIAYLINGKTWVNNHAHILHSYFNNSFLLYYLNQVDLHGYVSGTTRLKLTQGSLRKIPLRIAPIPEQRAIVAKLEQLFSELDNGIANLKAAKDKLETYRQSVLKKAFEGELTNEWRKKNKSGKWKTVSIGSITDVKGGKRLPKGHTYSDTPTKIFYLRVKDFGTSQIDKSNLKHLRKETQNLISNYTISKKDVYISIAGTIGKAGWIDKELDGANLTENAAKIIGTKILNNKFLVYCLNSIDSQNQISEFTKATSQPKLALFRIKKIEIPLPSVLEQHQIVQAIESRFSVCDRLSQDIDKNLKKAESLRQSILRQSFEGKLLNETELRECRKQPDWEPTEKLLQRIKASKISKPKKRKK